MSLETTQQVATKQTIREQGIESMYQAFFDYYAEELKKNTSKFNKFRLHLTTMFFDDLELIKRLKPHFDSVPTNVAEKQAVAKAAYWEALLRHALTAMTDREKQMLFDNCNELADKLSAVEKAVKKHLEDKLAALKDQESLRSRIYDLEQKLAAYLDQQTLKQDNPK